MNINSDLASGAVINEFFLGPAHAHLDAPISRSHCLTFATKINFWIQRPRNRGLVWRAGNHTMQSASITQNPTSAHQGVCNKRFTNELGMYAN